MNVRTACILGAYKLAGSAFMTNTTSVVLIVFQDLPQSGFISWLKQIREGQWYS